MKQDKYNSCQGPH